MPFPMVGIDIAGPFPVAAGGLKFLIVAIDYFTKWIEAKAVATITGNQGTSCYRANDASHAEDTGKLDQMGRPSRGLRKSLGKGAYKLRTWKGVVSPAREYSNLKKCNL
ncbi:reverse transcriptase domain-containing protein [Tanacetum coccineum]